MVTHRIGSDIIGARFKTKIFLLASVVACIQLPIPLKDEMKHHLQTGHDLGVFSIYWHPKKKLESRVISYVWKLHCLLFGHPPNRVIGLLNYFDSKF